MWAQTQELAWDGWGPGGELSRGPHVSILLSWVSYLSIASVSEPFLNFQWDALLLEVYLISIFFVPWRVFDNKDNIESPPTIGLQRSDLSQTLMSI